MNDTLKIMAVYHKLSNDINSVTKQIGPVGPKGDKGDKGDPGKDGVDGKDGKDGRNGVDGKDGKDGADGEDGISIVGVQVDFDNHLRLTMSDDSLIDAGEINVNVGGNKYYATTVTQKQFKDYVDMNEKGMSSKFTAGEALSAGELCYIDANGKMVKANASAESTADGLLGLTLADVEAGSIGRFLIKGFYGATGFTAGDTLFVSAVAGEITSVKPLIEEAIVRVVGYALSSTQIFFDPDKTWVEVNNV